MQSRRVQEVPSKAKQEVKYHHPFAVHIFTQASRASQKQEATAQAPVKQAVAQPSAWKQTLITPPSKASPTAIAPVISQQATKPITSALQQSASAQPEQYNSNYPPLSGAPLSTSASATPPTASSTAVSTTQTVLNFQQPFPTLQQKYQPQPNYPPVESPDSSQLQQEQPPSYLLPGLWSDDSEPNGLDFSNNPTTLPNRDLPVNTFGSSLGTFAQPEASISYAPSH